MKANRTTTGKVIWQALGGVAVLLALASCAPPPPQSAPPPSRQPMVAPPAPPLVATPGWRDMPISPGTWSWQAEGRQSVARFGVRGDGQLALRCDPARQAVVIERFGSDGAQGDAAGPVTLSISTSSMVRPVLAEARAGAVTVALGARDPLLDAMAFSRGRFAIEVQGMAALYVPSDSEISRVIEDCR